jgi:uncharacterized membrane protein
MPAWTAISLFLLAALGLLFIPGPVQFPPAGGPPPTQQASAMELLRQRYARGEIDNTTFEQMRERLEASYGQR